MLKAFSETYTFLISALINRERKHYISGEKVVKEKEDKIRESAEEIVDSFAEIAEGLPTQKETYYEQETLNVLKSDGEPISEEELENFRKNFLKIMPQSDDEGNLKVEVAEWTK